MTSAATWAARSIFWLRVLPAVNFDWISFAAGMTSMRFTPFIVFSALGMLLPTALTVAAGNGLDGNPRLTFMMGGLWLMRDRGERRVLLVPSPPVDSGQPTACPQHVIRESRWGDFFRTLIAHGRGITYDGRSFRQATIRPSPRRCHDVCPSRFELSHTGRPWLTSP